MASTMAKTAFVAVMAATLQEAAGFSMGPASSFLRPSLRSAACSSSLSSLSMVAADDAQVSRREALGALAGIGALAFAPSTVQAADFKDLENGKGLKYSVVVAGKGAKPKIGDLVAIRFKASFDGKEFDNCFKTANAYYYRVGSESVIQGLDLAVQNMRVGDRWVIQIPPALAFGEKGVKPSPGKPRIPGNAVIEYEVFFETFPGAEDEILEVTGGEYPT
eukprot:CAMPEP_0181323970 /NCGR_PEP_ID=MMETSP1101-20121128/20087_1 /TAXON_ID=46948 /ORGANISM="Rhodomonas abbreviata, Strain Caron Lab Isolate" /LENGTH=219 /DNA_ID=CAMNT_0023432069 /DNA_START=20 /DNA_END=679 /DNA_ORIENTATION=+